MGVTKFLGALALAAAFGLMASAGAEAQQTQSRLYEVTKSKKLRVCQFPLYYSISFRNPKSGEIEGIDADLAKELAKELDAKLEIVETSFGTFIADLQAGKCEIGMFGVGATLKRAQAVEFSKPYLITNIYVVTRKDSKIKKWEDLDQKGVKTAASLGSYIDTYMRDYLKNAEVISIAPPNTREADGDQSNRRVRLGDLHPAGREARRDALLLCRAAGRPDLAQLHQPVRRHHQARRSADEVRQEAQARPDRGAVTSVVSTEARSAERRDLLSTIGHLSWREGLSARACGPRSRRRESSALAIFVAPARPTAEVGRH